MKRFKKTELLCYIENATKENNGNKLSLVKLANYINENLNHNDYTEDELLELKVTERIVRYYIELYELKDMVSVRTNKKKYTRKGTSL